MNKAARRRSAIQARQNAKAKMAGFSNAEGLYGCIEEQVQGQLSSGEREPYGRAAQHSALVISDTPWAEMTWAEKKKAQDKNALGQGVQRGGGDK